MTNNSRVFSTIIAKRSFSVRINIIIEAHKLPSYKSCCVTYLREIYAESLSQNVSPPPKFALLPTKFSRKLPAEPNLLEYLPPPPLPFGKIDYLIENKVGD